MNKRVAVAALALVAVCMPAYAAQVSVTVTAGAGASPEGIVVFFDPKDETVPPAHRIVVIDQVNRPFVPHLTVIRTGTVIKFPNSDNVRHEAYSFSEPKTCTLKPYSGQPSEPVLFDKPGLVVLGCNIHDRMVGFVGVVDTPYFGGVNAADLLSLELPAGHYRPRVLHPGLSAPVGPRDWAVENTSLAIQVPVSIDLALPAPAASPD